MQSVNTTVSFIVMLPRHLHLKGTIKRCQNNRKAAEFKLRQRRFEPCEMLPAKDLLFPLVFVITEGCSSSPCFMTPTGSFAFKDSRCKEAGKQIKSKLQWLVKTARRMSWLLFICLFSFEVAFLYNRMADSLTCQLPLAGSSRVALMFQCYSCLEDKGLILN